MTVAELRRKLEDLPDGIEVIALAVDGQALPARASVETHPSIDDGIPHLWIDGDPSKKWKC